MIKQFHDYATSFLNYAGRRAAFAFGFVFAGGLLEGVGLLFLVPFLELFAGSGRSSISLKISNIMESFGVTTKESQLLVALGGFLVLLFLRNINGWLRDTRIMTLSYEFVDGWRSRLFEALAHAPWPQITQLQRTDIEHAITNDVARLSVATDRILRGSVNLVMLIVQIIIAFYLSPAQNPVRSEVYSDR